MTSGIYIFVGEAPQTAGAHFVSAGEKSPK
jgi:hypothetical protein